MLASVNDVQNPKRPWARRALVCAGLFVLAASTSAAAAGDAPAQDVTVPVKLTERLASDTAKEGRQFTFVTTQDVSIGDVTVPAGTTGHGVVVSARPARWDRGGDLALRVESLDLPGGRSVPVAAAPHGGPQSEKHNVAKEAVQAAGDVKSAGGLGSMLVPLSAPVHGIVLLGSALRMLKGHDVVFDSGTRFSVVASPPQNAPTPAPSD